MGDESRGTQHGEDDQHSQDDEGGDADHPVPDEHKKNGNSAGRNLKAGLIAVRDTITSAIWLVAVVCAVFLVVGALLVALNANPDNIVRIVFVSGADLLDGPLSREDGLFTFDGDDAAIKNVLVNWGLAAVVYLAVGRIVHRVIHGSV